MSDDTATATAEVVIRPIPIADLHESPFNPRKTFLALDELAADIRAVGGIAQPLLVRPRVPALFAGDDSAACGFEIVFGHRRFRAAQMVGLQRVPCMVRSLSDAEARRLQVSENLQRQDVHPIEEAEGFQALIDDDGLTAEQLAQQFGKSLSYVYARLKLLQACHEVREACLEGRIGSEVALLVARIRSVKLQEKALAALKSNHHNLEDGGKSSFRRIRSFLKERFTLQLTGRQRPIFSIESADLVPSAGACTTCPKRSGNAPEFSDIAEDRPSPYFKGQLDDGEPDLCTDPECYEAKKRAHLAAQAAELEAAGKTVISGAKARQVVSATGEIKGGYVSMAAARAMLAEAGLKATKLKHVVVQDPRGGKTHEAVSLQTLHAAGLQPPQKDARGAGQRDRAARDWEAERKAREARAATNNEHRERLMRAFHAQERGQVRTLSDLQIVADHTLGMLYHMGHHFDCRRLADLWGYPSVMSLQEAVRAGGVLSPNDLALLVLECAMVCDSYSSEHEGEDPPHHLLAACQQHGITDPAEASPPHPPAARAQEGGAAGGKGKKTAATEVVPSSAWPFPVPAASGGKARSEGADAPTGAAEAAQGTDELAEA